LSKLRLRKEDKPTRNEDKYCKKQNKYVKTNAISIFDLLLARKIDTLIY